MKQMSLTGIAIQSRDIPNDVFLTPQELAKKLIEKTDIEPYYSLYDPFKGEGAFFDNYPPQNQKEWAEIEKGRDFFESNEKFDFIISNPPFSKLTDVLIHSTNICKIGFGYIMPSYSLSFSRIMKMKNYGFQIRKMVYFENPKEWKLGFQMVYVVFMKDYSGNQEIEVILPNDYNDSIQTKLNF